MPSSTLVLTIKSLRQEVGFGADTDTTTCSFVFARNAEVDFRKSNNNTTAVQKVAFT